MSHAPVVHAELTMEMMSRSSSCDKLSPPWVTRARLCCQLPPPPLVPLPPHLPPLWEWGSGSEDCRDRGGEGVVTPLVVLSRREEGGWDSR